MNRLIQKKVATFYYKMAEIIFIGVVIGGIMQPVMPDWKVMIGLVFAAIHLLVGIAFDYAYHQKPP